MDAIFPDIDPVLQNIICPYKVRFRVRTINFTRLTTSFKGVQATTTSEIHNSSLTNTALVKSETDSTGEKNRPHCSSILN